MTFFSSLVFHGDKMGREIGFPTVNLDPTIIPQETKPGVWAVEVDFAQKKYAGALYFGPRTIKGEEKNVLEIFILDFSQEIYGETVQFRFIEFIRPVLHFKTLPEITLQLQKDIAAVKDVFHDQQN